MPVSVSSRLALRTWSIGGFALLGIALAWLLPAIAQPVEYHDFADRRAWFGVPNFLDVASNAGFVLAGVVGLVIVARQRTVFASDAERWPYAVFFTALWLTGLGSAYYHLMPDNARLFWDRLAMSVAFMSLIAAQIVDRIDVKAGLVSHVPLLAIGVASVIYWRMTEAAGAGNLSPYGVLQAWTTLLLLLIAAFHPSRYTHGGAIYALLCVYAIAKGLEHFDREILAWGGFVSGHTSKHLVAAIGGAVVCVMLLRRRLRARTAQPRSPHAE